MAENDVQIDIKVDASQATKSIEDFGDKAKKSVIDTEKAFKGLGSVFNGFTAAIGLAIAGVASFSKALEEATVEEKSVRKLNLALASTGEFSKEASASILAFADSMEDLTGIQGEVIQDSFTLAKTFGITNDRAQELVTAAANLSAITGDDLETAVRQLGGTLDGSVGKIGLLGSEFRDLTAEQLKNGDAVKLINERYNEAAESLGDSFTGRIAILKKNFDDVFKAIGTEIIGDQTINRLLLGLADSIKQLIPIFSEVTKIGLKFFNIIIEGFSRLISIAAAAGGSIGKFFGIDSLTKASQNLEATFNNLTAGLVQARTEVESNDTSVSKFEKTLLKVNESAKKATKSVGKQAEESLKAFESFKNKILGQTVSNEEEKIRIKYDIERKEFEKLTKEKALTDKQSVEGLTLIRIAEEKEFSEFRRKKAEEDAKAARASIEKFAASPVEILFSNDPKTSASVAATIASAFDRSLNGRQGAVSVLSELGGKFADTLLPGIGGVVGSILTKLAAGPEQAKAFVKEFISAIPDIIVAIIDALPEALAAIVEKVFSAEFIVRVFKLGAKTFVLGITGGFSAFGPIIGRKIAETFVNSAADDFAERVVTGLRKFGDELSEKLKAVFAPIANIGEKLTAFGNNLVNGLSSVFGGFTQGIKNVFDATFGALKTLFDPLLSAIQSLKEAFEKAGNFGGVGESVGGFVQQVGSALGFSKGGVVPLYAAQGAFVPRGTDTVPAMLTPGELVVPTDMTAQLGKFLNNQDSQPADNTALLFQILSAVQAPVNVNTEVKVNNQVFADIILNLNRQNARLRA